ncbi:hypothetical protein C8R47DRAFT_226195 [Mycena vitilis]|nr:hypothetical protein C8R47DRAFT_226195 [Mycena vitilis]
MLGHDGWRSRELGPMLVLAAGRHTASPSSMHGYSTPVHLLCRAGAAKRRRLLWRNMTSSRQRAFNADLLAAGRHAAPTSSMSRMFVSCVSSTSQRRRASAPSTSTLYIVSPRAGLQRRFLLPAGKPHAFARHGTSPRYPGRRSAVPELSYYI